MNKFWKKNLFLFLVLTIFLCLLFFVWPKKQVSSLVDTIGECQPVLALGQIPKRALEIQNEMIQLLAKAEEDFSEINKITVQISQILSRERGMQFYKRVNGELILTGNIDGRGMDSECDCGKGGCGGPCSGGLTDYQKREIARLYEKARNLEEEVKETRRILLEELSPELDQLKDKLNNTGTKLAQRDLERTLLFNCFHAQSIGLRTEQGQLIECQKSGLDYYICPIL